MKDKPHLSKQSNKSKKYPLFQMPHRNEKQIRFFKTATPDKYGRIPVLLNLYKGTRSKTGGFPIQRAARPNKKLKKRPKCLNTMLILLTKTIYTDRDIALFTPGSITKHF